MGIAKATAIPIMKNVSLPAARIPIRLAQIGRGSALCILLFLPSLATVLRADVTDQELKQWLEDSTLTFKGTIVSLGSNVDSVNSSDEPMIVKVENVERGNDAISRNFGSLVGEQMTVVVDPLFKSGPERKPGVSAVFFVNPLLYEKHIAVTAVAIANNQTVKNLPKRLSAAVEQDKRKPLNDALKTADLVVSGAVQEVKTLPDEKLAKLQSLANGRDLYSEHSPRWMEAIIRVQSVLKGNPAEKIVMVVFPSTDDRMWAESPKFKAGQRGTWLLHTRDQLAEDRAKILLTAEQFHGQQVNAYTALDPEDFHQRDPAGKNEKQIRDMLRNTNPP
jgi:hypothetical protein